MAQPETPVDPTRINVNQVVAYNVREARRTRGWTQEALALRLEAVTGIPFSLATVSALERTWEGDRRRQFDAQMLTQLAVALDVPIAWFFLPPPDEKRFIERLSRTVPQLHVLLLGREDQVGPLDERVRELSKHFGPEDLEALRRVTGSRSVVGVESYRERRKELLLALLDQHADDLDRAADELGKFFDHLRQVGIRGLVAENAMDADFATSPEHRSVTPDSEETSTDAPPDEPPDGPPADDTSTSLEPASTARRSR